jgi:transcriptional regulator with XRE-family HTH domain
MRGSEIVELRKRHRIRQEELAQELGIRRETLSKLEQVEKVRVVYEVAILSFFNDASRIVGAINRRPVRLVGDRKLRQTKKAVQLEVAGEFKSGSKLTPEMRDGLQKMRLNYGQSKGRALGELVLRLGEEWRERMRLILEGAHEPTQEEMVEITRKLEDSIL